MYYLANVAQLLDLMPFCTRISFLASSRPFRLPVLTCSFLARADSRPEGFRAKLVESPTIRKPSGAYQRVIDALVQLPKNNTPITKVPLPYSSLFWSSFLPLSQVVHFSCLISMVVSRNLHNP
jgi:hypothetical protein